jgi:uncharacterized HAD superfamily protein
MKIGIDIDGIITPVGFINPSVKLPRWLYIFLMPLMLLMIPCKKEELERIRKEGHEVILISARPPWSKPLTEAWLKYHRIPFSKIYCVGFGKGTKQRKLKVIKEERVEIFIENDKRVRKFLRHNSVKAVKEFQQLKMAEKAIFYILKTNF